MKHSKNPLSGKASFDRHGNLWMDTDIKFGGQIEPQVTPREWFYLVWNACQEVDYPIKKTKKLVDNWLGSRATAWRTKRGLIKKGLL